MIHVELRIGPYIITPLVVDGRVLIDVLKIEEMDSHDHPVGETRTVDVDKLFEESR